MEMSSWDVEKRELVTLDLLGGAASPVDGAARNIGFCPKTSSSFGRPRDDLHPPDLNLRPDAAGASCGTKAAAATMAPTAGAQSVCTIEQVKRALERAERESRGRDHTAQRRRRREGAEYSSGAGSPSPSSSSSSSITTASNKRSAEGSQEGGWEEGSESGGGGSLVAAGCPSCLSYVLIPKNNPRCPRCESQVPAPVAQQKRPRIDLNFTLTIPSK
ncbi:hypothetical protein Cni_G28394 [Canna indica]|uniref:GIR1-like zinc ribbon domain-containing protein n=1 Tax=Canna indica TaxID=4628 RepID=A0AAQ3L9K7_9LILI|nr:hypothetical protein Cni_G28394 [Canna indica]